MFCFILDDFGCLFSISLCSSVIDLYTDFHYLFIFSRDETTLYERVSVRWSVRWSVGPLVRPSVTLL